LACAARQPAWASTAAAGTPGGRITDGLRAPRDFFAERHMSIIPGWRVSALANWLSRPPGRHQRRQWTGNGRAHIEVKGVYRPEHADLARQVQDELAQLDGVRWAEVNPVAGRAVVAFDDSQLGVDDLIKVIERAEEAYGVAAGQFLADRLEHPADTEPPQRQVYAIGTEALGVGLGLVGRVIRAQPLLPEVASLVSLADAMPAVRRRLENWFGYSAADLGLAAGNALAQGLAQGPFGLLVDIANRLAAARAGAVRAGQRRPAASAERGTAPCPPSARPGGVLRAPHGAGRRGRRGGGRPAHPRYSHDGGRDGHGRAEGSAAWPGGLRRVAGTRPGPFRRAGHG
jgi:copper chaperone CopZ